GPQPRGTRRDRRADAGSARHAGRRATRGALRAGRPARRSGGEEMTTPPPAGVPGAPPRPPGVTPPIFRADPLLADPDTHVIITCGSGGVGKTTTAAALATRAADQGRTVAVLTIDPARRLAQSLGLTELGNTPRRI